MSTVRPDEPASGPNPDNRFTWHAVRKIADMPHIGFLPDMDGVIYRGSKLIPGASDFITRFRKHQIPFRFLTNISQRARRDVALKLRRLG